MLSFQNLSEEEIEKMGLLPKGRYWVKVIKSEPHPDGKNQINLLVQARSERQVVNIKSYLSTNGKYMLLLLRHFCYATGLEESYKKERLTYEECEDKECLADIDIQVGGDKYNEKGQPNGKWNDKNIIVDWIKPTEQDFKDDDVPF